MKRILLFVALLIFVVGVCNSAGIDESPLYGTYMRAVEYSDGDYSLDLFHLFPDHTAYRISRWVSDGKVDISGEEMTTWMFTGEGRVQLLVNGVPMTFIMGTYGELKTDESLPEKYIKVYPRRDWQ